MKKIVQKNEAVLRKIASDVPLEKITSAKIQNILLEMKEAMDSQDDGVAIAAPQIGYSLRIFLVSDKIDSIIAKDKKKKTVDPESLDEVVEKRVQHYVFINPQIIKISKEKKLMDEGCLSVRYLYGKVKRAQKALVEAYDENGQKFSLGGVGLLAQIFQHEIDHLDGILFIDKAKQVEEIIPKHLQK